jgi:hypothetical protein
MVNEKHNAGKASEPRTDEAATYKLTGETGSYRYMAPEVFRHEPYNLKVGRKQFLDNIFLRKMKRNNLSPQKQGRKATEVLSAVQLLHPN